MPDLSWLTNGRGDTQVIAAMVALCLLVAVAAPTIRYGHHAVPAARWVWRSGVRIARWAGRRWDAWHAGCPRCPHCQGARRDKAGTHWAAIRRPRPTATYMSVPRQGGHR